jgi:hypothetical protein
MIEKIKFNRPNKRIIFRKQGEKQKLDGIIKDIAEKL